MGAGAERAAKQLAPAAPAILRRRVREAGRYLEDRGTHAPKLLIETGMGLGIFQTKCHHGDQDDLNLIALTAQKLALFAGRHPDLRIAVNFPGVGLGRLNRGRVREALEAFWSELPLEVSKLTPGRYSSRLPRLHAQTTTAGEG